MDLNLENNTNSKNKVVATIDPGTSLLKVVYTVNNSRADWLTMGAECMGLPASKKNALPKFDKAASRWGRAEIRVK